MSFAFGAIQELLALLAVVCIEIHRGNISDCRILKGVPEKNVKKGGNTTMQQHHPPVSPNVDKLFVGDRQDRIP